jgi:phytoene dehydrogenase-like protein
MSTLNLTRTPRDRVYSRLNQYLDIQGTLKSFSTKFLALSPNLAPKIDNWTAEFKASFDKKIQNKKARYIFFAKKRANYI